MTAARGTLWLGYLEADISSILSLSIISWRRRTTSVRFGRRQHIIYRWQVSVDCRHIEYGRRARACFGEQPPGR